MLAFALQTSTTECSFDETTPEKAASNNNEHIKVN
jgi:hypothetical protein